MKNFLVITSLILTFNTNAQLRDFRIVNGSDVKIDLSLINDSLAYISFEEFGYDQYILGKYEIDRDTIKFTELSDFLDIKSDVFYSLNNELPKNKIEIQSKYNHLFLRGESTFNNLTYKVKGKEYSVQSDDPLHTSLNIDIVQGPFKIELFNGGEYIGEIEANVPKGMNVVQIRTVELYSVYDYSYNLDELLPKKFIIDNYEYHLQVSLQD